MNRFSRNTAVVILSFVLVFAITACSFGGDSAEKAVEKYVELNKDNVEVMASFGEVTCELDSDLTSVVYKYTYNNMNDFTSSQIEDLENALADEESSIINVLRMMTEEESNISSIIYEFYESDGDLILSREYY